MKKVKKLSAVCLMIILVVCSSLPILAATPRAVSCPLCNKGGLVRVYVGHTLPETHQSKACEHGYFLETDYLISWYDTYGWKCTTNGCQYQEGADSVYHLEWQCGHGKLGPQV